MSVRGMFMRLAHPFLRFAYRIHNSKPRRSTYNDLDLVVHPGVFHPGFFGSSIVLADHIKTLDLNGSSFLDLGAGSGIVALVAAGKGAVVTASDISDAAIANLHANAERTQVRMHIVRSDLFASLPQHFEYIAINPPYYPKVARNEAELAFYSGTGHDYFRRLLPELAPRIRDGTHVLMVLSEDLDLAPIRKLAINAGLVLKAVHSKSHLGETQTVFQVALC